ncbi:zinc finger protein brutus-like [Quercus suber]|uniref:Zinc finger protein brutus-like n=1 Tax=Quercus suber TaxID=58331 RepID=A0AAW0JMW2_QUESU
MADDDDDTIFPLAESLAGVSLSHAPILFFVCFHKALRAELSQLRRLAVAESESESESSHRCDVVVELRRRFEFLKLVCKYHCAAEDEEKMKRKCGD